MLVVFRLVVFKVNVSVSVVVGGLLGVGVSMGVGLVGKVIIEMFL